MLEYFLWLLQNWLTIWLIVCLLVALKFTVEDLNNVRKESTSHSRTWAKAENGGYPSLIDLIDDLWYIKNNWKRKWKNFIVTFLIFAMLAKYLKMVVPLYTISFLLSTIYFTAVILIKKITNSEYILNINYEINIKNLHIRELILFISSPIRWALIFIYLIIAKKINKFELVGGPAAASILFLRSPLWFIVSCFTWSAKITDIIFSEKMRRKKWKGKLRTALAEIKEFILLRNFTSMNITFRITNGRRIIISGGVIRINGGASALFKECASFEAPKFMIPYRVYVGKEWHQAFIKSEGSDQFFTLTSGKEIKSNRGETYKTIRVDYSSRNEQYVALSYIDQNTIPVEKGWVPNPAIHNKLQTHEYFFGLVVKLEILYNYYDTDKVLFQSEGFKFVHTLPKCVPASVSHLDQCKVDFRNLREAAELATIKSKAWGNIDKEVDAAVNKILVLSGNDVYNIVKKDLKGDEFKNISEAIIRNKWNDI